MKKVFGQESCQVQIKLTATYYSRPLFIQGGSKTVSKALMKIPGTISLKSSRNYPSLTLDVF